MTTPTRPLADLEVDALAHVDAEWTRRATGTDPWTLDVYLNKIIAVHASYTTRRQQDGGRS